jgi:MFS family permease
MPRSYAELLRRPAIRWLMASSLVARLPMSMSGLAVILAVTDADGSYTRAGAVLAAYVVAEGIAQPLVGRAADRIGRRRVLRTLAVLNAVASVGLALAITLPVVPLLAMAAVTGATMPPIAATVRAAWGTLLKGPAQQSAYALEATAQELLFIVGPPLAALLAALVSPRFGLGATGVLGLVGVIAMTRGHEIDAKPVDDDGPRHRGSALRIGALRRAMITLGLMVLGLNCVELGVIAAISGGQKAETFSGIALALWSAGSMVGGFVYGARGGSLRAPASLVVGAAAVGFASLAAVPDNRVAIVAVLAAGGSMIAPMFGRMYAEVGAGVPASVMTEAYSWIAVGNLTGAAIGAPLGGYLVSAAGSRVSFLAAGAAGLLAAIAAHGLREAVTDRADGPEAGADMALTASPATPVAP